MEIFHVEESNILCVLNLPPACTGVTQVLELGGVRPSAREMGVVMRSPITLIYTAQWLSVQQNHSYTNFQMVSELQRGYILEFVPDHCSMFRQDCYFRSFGWCLTTPPHTCPVVTPLPACMDKKCSLPYYLFY